MFRRFAIIHLCTKYLVAHCSLSGSSTRAVFFFSFLDGHKKSVCKYLRAVCNFAAGVGSCQLATCHFVFAVGVQFVSFSTTVGRVALYR